VSGGSALTKITDGAVSFDGSGDYLSISDGSDLELGSGDFTIEGYYYFKNTGSSGTNFWGKWASAPGRSYAFSYVKSSGKYIFGYSTDGTNENLSADFVSQADIERWVHFAAVRSGTSLKVYRDGKEIIDHNISTTTIYNSSANLMVGRLESNSNYDINGFVSNFRLIKGTALYTSNFTPPSAPLTDVTNTKLLCCKSPTSATAYDVSPGTITANGNAAATNFNPFTTNINAVRGQESGYATLNPLDKLSNVTLSNGNLTCTSGANVEGVRSTIPFPRTGMWYVEYHMDTVTTNGYPVTGIANASKSLSAYAGAGTASVRPKGSGRDLGWVINSSDTPSGYMWTGFALSAGGDTMQIAFNADQGAFYMGVNNFWWGLSGSNAIRVSTADMLNGTNSAYDVSGDDYFAWTVPYEGKCTLNYGQKPFKFPPPEGFQPLNAANARPSTVIARPDQYVGVTTYTGNSTSSSTLQSFNIGWKPDLLWIKRRSTTNAGHAIYDTVRGTTQRLSSSQTTVFNNEGYFESFDDRGFTVKGDSNNTNNSGDSFVAWTWKAGGNSNTFNIDGVGYDTASAAGLTSGNLTGASVNTKNGFSILKYTGNSTGSNTGSEQELSHNMGKAPAFVIAKNLDRSHNWNVLHHKFEPFGYAYYRNALYLNTTDTAPNTDNVRPWGGVAPTTSIITVSNATTANSQMSLNYNGDDYILYMWAEIPGFSKFGSYIGTGASPNYVHLGFRPALIIIKNVGTNGSPSTTNNWLIQDSKRNTYNQINDTLYPNLSDPEANSSSNFGIDFLNNGFALRTTGGYATNSNNASEGHTFIYAAWAEAPTFNLYGAQSNAR